MSFDLTFLPPVIAHRGASAYAPENTLVAFVKAIQLGCKWIEFDVMQSICGEAIIFHDETLERTTSGGGKVNDYFASYLRSLDAGVWFHSQYAGERVPTLAQTVDFLSNARIGMNIELKPALGGEERLVTEVLSIINQYAIAQKAPILFSSFSIKTLQTLRRLAPQCLIGLLLHEWSNDWQALAKELECSSIHLLDEIVTPDWAQAIKADNKKLLCYTVNDVKRALALFSLGADAVFSDMPDVILQGLTNGQSIN